MLLVLYLTLKHDSCISIEKPNHFYSERGYKHKQTSAGIIFNWSSQSRVPVWKDWRAGKVSLEKETLCLSDSRSVVTNRSVILSERASAGQEREQQSKSSKKNVSRHELWRLKTVKILIYLSWGVWTLGLKLAGCWTDVIWIADAHHQTFPADTLFSYTGPSPQLYMLSRKGWSVCLCAGERYKYNYNTIIL